MIEGAGDHQSAGRAFSLMSPPDRHTQSELSLVTPHGPATIEPVNIGVLVIHNERREATQCCRRQASKATRMSEVDALQRFILDVPGVPIACGIVRPGSHSAMGEKVSRMRVEMVDDGP